MDTFTFNLFSRTPSSFLLRGFFSSCQHPLVFFLVSLLHFPAHKAKTISSVKSVCVRTSLLKKPSCVFLSEVTLSASAENLCSSPLSQQLTLLPVLQVLVLIEENEPESPSFTGALLLVLTMELPGAAFQHRFNSLLTLYEGPFSVRLFLPTWLYMGNIQSKDGIRKALVKFMRSLRTQPYHPTLCLMSELPTLPLVGLKTETLGFRRIRFQHRALI